MNKGAIKGEFVRHYYATH